MTYRQYMSSLHGVLPPLCVVVSASPRTPASSSGALAGTKAAIPGNHGTGNCAPATAPLGRLGHVRTYAAEVKRGAGAVTVPAGALGQSPKRLRHLQPVCLALAAAVLTGCRTVGPVVRLSKCARVTIEIHHNGVEGQQGKTITTSPELGRGAQVPVGPGGVTQGAPVFQALPDPIIGGIGGACRAEPAVTPERPDVDAQPLEQ